MEAPSRKKRVRNDSDESCMSLRDAKTLKQELSNVKANDSDLECFIGTFENEISAVDLSADSCESQPELGFLLEASDDELGLPPPTSSLEKGNNELVRDASQLSELWGFESGYDSFDLGFGDADVTCDHSCISGGEFVTVDGLFDYSDMCFESSDILLRAKNLPAL